jgi:hypothetical protein
LIVVVEAIFTAELKGTAAQGSNIHPPEQKKNSGKNNFPLCNPMM